jgi:ubiquinone/menaquinone biosynthesis C-methylase UbiE
MKSYINSQFKVPSGACGALVGLAMAKIYKQRMDWTVETLDVKEGDHILEIGFGPGVAIQQISAIAPKVFIAGVDLSKMMVRQAKRRNRKAIRSGRVDIQHGSVNDLPYGDNCFDKVFAINSFHHWPLPQGPNLKEIRRVLKPSGKIFVTEQPHWVANEIEALKIAAGYKGELIQSGFRKVEIRSKIMEPSLCFILVGIKSTPLAV